ncbi:sn-glycerol-3-phosphate ABC transporter ATP-binding protein UgpC [Kiritimatiellaeota bacterium B1221]|nr:sn-glycerol-3-phosphate ABC transporter ATP-binding protein UgpC [Kiritimatiellaeota bacterium B1221]
MAKTNGNVSIKQLKKTYLDGKGKPVFTAVKGINLEIENGEFMVLVGPSGCGKSTTLRMVAGLEDISEGTISIGETVVNKLEPKDRGIAMVFQNYALYPHLSVFTNMAFSLQLNKVPKAEIKKRVQKAAEILGLTEMLDRKPKALSGGQRQRVAVGRSIVRDPKVFLFDEPLSNLDAKMRVQMRTEISNLHERLGTTILYVTHDQVEAMTMGDRICVMNEGEIMQVADPLTLYKKPENMFVASFIGSPPMNLIHGELQIQDAQVTFIEEGGSGHHLGRIQLKGPLAEKAKTLGNRKIVFGMRPEHLNERSQCENEAVMTAPVSLAEPMGAETLLHLEMAQHRVIGRIQNDRLFKRREEVTLYLNLDKCSLFDPKTEQVL